MEPLKYDKVESFKHPGKDLYVVRWFKKNFISYNRRKRAIQIGGHVFIKELLIDGFDLLATPKICLKCTIRYGQLIPKPECHGDFGE